MGEVPVTRDAWCTRCGSRLTWRARCARCDPDPNAEIAALKAEIARLQSERDYLSAMLQTGREEITRLREENERLDKMVEEKIDRADIPAADALDKLWNEIILARKPNYGPWEYPGQAYNHIMAEIREMVEEARDG